MRRIFKIWICISSIALPIFCAGCSEKTEFSLKYGTYVNEANGMKIILDEGTLVVQNYDFSEDEALIYETYTINKAAVDYERPLTEDETQKICDSIDLNTQFLNVENVYESMVEDGCIGVYVPVNGTELFFYLQYYPSNSTLVYNSNIRLSYLEES